MLKILRNLFYVGVVLFIFGIIIAWTYAKKLEHDYHLDDQDLGGALWSMPARVYARPLELYVGAPVSLEQLVRELKLLEYQKTSNVIKPEQYSVSENSVIYYAPEFHFWDQTRHARRMQIQFDNGKISAVDDLTSLEPVALERLNPLRIASIYPQHREDRILVKLSEVPEVLIDTILVTEDRNFWKHPGIDPKGLIRSIYVTFVKKQDQQGGSTLTQQFIKNHYLTNERKISRKIKEMLMALVLERHATKKQILEGYLNEIYLGQDGQRAIHGFGLASEYYFNKKLNELNLHQIALLVALVREPGNADPRAHPEYAIRRRNLILSVMAQQGLISHEDEKLAAALPLDVVPKEKTRDRIRFPAFVDLVYQQLYQNYNKEDLTKQGLNIFTTLNPQVQEDMQNTLSDTLPKLERSKGLRSKFLQGAAVIVDAQTAEVVSVVGSRVSGEQGFNRALSAKRQIGSLVKPMVYLSALEYPTRYSLSTLLDDSPLNYSRGGEKWSPKNYDRRNHGQVMLIDSLVKSYNIPTVRIALDLGLNDIVGTLKRLGARDNIRPYPSLALGAVQMTPLEVAQIYETFASGGYYQPLRSIREITTLDGKVVHRFEMKSIRAIEPTPYYLIMTAMQEIPRRGTAASIYKSFDKKYNFAGKTGTTDDYRDSWFAGFAGNYLTVAWVGNDQNRSTKLSGGTGGLPLWVALMKKLSLEPLMVKQPDGIVTAKINRNNGLVAGSGCGNTLNLPFIAGYQPGFGGNCAAPRPVMPQYDDIYDSGFGGFSAPRVDMTPPRIDNPPPVSTGDPSGWFNN